MKTVAALALLILLFAPATASAQCTVPGCEAATAVVSEARATARAIITQEAPPTWTPQPTVAPTATATATPEPTQTPQPTATVTMQPSATAAATATMVATVMPSATQAPAVERGEDIAAQRWQVFGILLFCIALLGGLLWFMRDRTFYIPRGDRHDDRK